MCVCVCVCVDFGGVFGVGGVGVGAGVVGCDVVVAIVAFVVRDTISVVVVSGTADVVVSFLCLPIWLLLMALSSLVALSF